MKPINKIKVYNKLNKQLNLLSKTINQNKTNDYYN